MTLPKYWMFESLMAFSLVAVGFNFANFNFITAFVFFLIGFFSYGQCIILAKQLDIQPFYLKYMRRRGKQ